MPFLNTQTTCSTSCIAPDATIAEILQSPGFKDTGALVVSSDGRTIEGIVSALDIVRGLGRMGPALLSKPVRDLMTAKVWTCVPTDRVAGVMAFMVSRHVQHLPVVTDGKLVGMGACSTCSSCVWRRFWQRRMPCRNTSAGAWSEKMGFAWTQATAMNRLQFQPGLSMSAFFDQYATRAAVRDGNDCGALAARLCVTAYFFE